VRLAFLGLYHGNRQDGKECHGYRNISGGVIMKISIIDKNGKEVQIAKVVFEDGVLSIELSEYEATEAPGAATDKKADEWLNQLKGLISLCPIDKGGKPGFRQPPLSPWK